MQPGELAKRLRGDYQPSDSEEEEMSVAEPRDSEIEVALVGALPRPFDGRGCCLLGGVDRR